MNAKQARQVRTIRIFAAIVVLMLLFSFLLASQSKTAISTNDMVQTEDPQLNCPQPAEFVEAFGIIEILDQTTNRELGTIRLEENGILIIDTFDGQHREQANAQGGYEIVTIVPHLEHGIIVVLITRKIVFVCDGKLYHLPPQEQQPDPG